MEFHYQSYQLVAASKNDEVKIKQLIFGILKDYGLEPDGNTTDADLEAIHQCYFDNGGYFGVLVDEEDCIIGTAALYKINEEVAELRKMYLSAEYRGKGLGQFMLESLICLAKEKGFRRLTLETASVLQEAIGLYIKNGFQPFDSKHLAKRCDQAYELKLL